ncbi:phosphoenolpyruvate carboxykinase (ATP) [Traorella massiliensis]|uniref:hypothetical protein n=1 Tax=Traorella massiliensis TaxID=1903263 RepID=UPI0008F8E41E|nr:hypothetical protein [Traorella massiliensis]
MKESIYMNEQVAILNFSASYVRTTAELLNSPEFRNITEIFIESLKDTNRDLYNWILNGKTVREAKVEITRCFRLMSVFECNEIDNYYLNDKDQLLEFIEEFYNFWKHHQRFSVTFIGNGQTSTAVNYITNDSNFNRLIRDTYRRIEEKVQGRKNKIYRQLQSGTNAAAALRIPQTRLPEEYDCLKRIPMIDSIMLRTPLMLTTRSNKREGMFTERKDNPVEVFTGTSKEWFCMPIKIGRLLCFVYFHRDFMCSGVSLANLFEIATAEECTHKPDCIVLFGNQDGLNETTFYHDQKNDIWVGSVSYSQKIEYFGYIKKMSLTLHNLAMMQRGWLPIHGAFVNVTLRDGKKKGIMLMGDSGAGKSESIEALRSLGNEVISNIEVVFDDMGTIHIEDGVPYGQGTEIGAFIRLDDLDKGTPYRDMDRSVFLNPDSSNARVITPAASYDVVAHNHKIDLFAYANNYDKELGLRRIDDPEEVKRICIQGQRMALGTTQEVGLSRTYFANPFGPMQKQEVCQPLIDEVFECLYKNNVFVGEIFTHLGFSKEDRSGIQEGAKQLLEFIQKS